MEDVLKKLAGPLAVVLLIGITGCSGVQVRESISPTTFLLPGLLGEHDAAPALPVAEDPAVAAR